ncbi:hypothetical protein PoB_000591100 [Plakobranchus ocellatus]|uniref:Uncharacterized protein n=1 Tax=Plakobranchus ocellatus TaxID=259542 RepID=A0AAV3YAI2_9GAST|nr:hypothetical protein PoB_000591100 [Plakobranchus ocellatus]
MLLWPKTKLTVRSVSSIHISGEGSGHKGAHEQDNCGLLQKSKIEERNDQWISGTVSFDVGRLLDTWTSAMVPDTKHRLSYIQLCYPDTGLRSETIIFYCPTKPVGCDLNGVRVQVLSLWAALRQPLWSSFPLEKEHSNHIWISIFIWLMLNLRPD